MTDEWRDLVEQAGFDAAGVEPDEVEVAIVRTWRRRAARARATHARWGLTAEADHYGSTRDNVEAALEGLLDLLTGGAP